MSDSSKKMSDSSIKTSDASKKIPTREKMAKQNQKPKGDQKPKGQGNVDTKGMTVTREEDLSTWYTEMLTKAELISHYDVQDESSVYPLFSN
jgi:hypothetical protein